MIQNWKKRILWLLISLTIYFSGFSTYTKSFVRYGIEIPPLIFPLEQIRDNGRTLSAIFVILVILFSFLFISVNKTNTDDKKRKKYISDPLIISFLTVHLLIIFKLFEGYNSNAAWLDAVLSEVFFFLVTIMIIVGPGKVVSTKEDFKLVAQSICIAATLFVFGNFAQLLVNESALYYTGNDIFVGTTGNPQHAAALLTMSFPSLLYMLKQDNNERLKKIIWISTIIIGLYFLFQTGSRTGFIAFIIGMFAYFISKIKLIHWLIISSVFSFILPEWINLRNQIQEQSLNKLTTISLDSRTGNWTEAWENYNENILFGLPLSNSPIYIESSWLSLWATLGSVGFIISLVWFTYFIGSVISLSRIKKYSQELKEEANFVRSTLIAAFVVSFGEANLLGILTPYMLILLLNIVLLKFVTSYEENSIASSHPRAVSHRSIRSIR